MDNLFFELKKSDEESRMVWGYASTEALDSDGEVITRDAMQGAWDEYMKFGNLREMHQPSAVGTVKEHMFDPVGAWIGAKVVDDAAWEKVQEGVYKGFSIGGRVTGRDGDDATKVTGLRLNEISLVDRPANPEALITLFKAAEQTPGETAQGLSDVVTSLESLIEQARTDSETLEKLEKSMGGLSEALSMLTKEETPVAEETKEEVVEETAVEKSEEVVEEAPAVEPEAAPAEEPVEKAFADRLDTVVDVLESISKRLERLEAAPDSPRAALKSIAKAADVEVEEEPEPADALGFIKKAHQTGERRPF